MGEVELYRTFFISLASSCGIYTFVRVNETHQRQHSGLLQGVGMWGHFAYPLTKF